MKFPFLTQSNHEEEMALLEKNLTKKFNEKIHSVLRIVASATGRTMDDLNKLVADLVKNANSQAELARQKVELLRQELAAAEKELKTAEADLEEAESVQRDIE